jgi:hypothetical protein
MTQTQYTIRSRSRSASHVTKIWKRITQEPEVETPGVYPERSRRVPDWLSQLEQVEAELACMEHSAVIRPPWAPGLSTQELMEIARHENLNCYKYDWWDSIDSLIIRQAKQGGFRRNVRNTLTELRAKRAQLRGELSWTR